MGKGKEQRSETLGLVRRAGPADVHVAPPEAGAAGGNGVGAAPGADGGRSKSSPATPRWR